MVSYETAAAMHGRRYMHNLQLHACAALPAAGARQEQGKGLGPFLTSDGLSSTESSALPMRAATTPSTLATCRGPVVSPLRCSFRAALDSASSAFSVAWLWSAMAEE